MKTIKEFLTAYADKFPDKIVQFYLNKTGESSQLMKKESLTEYKAFALWRFLEKTRQITFDYADGLITFFRKIETDSPHIEYEVTGWGGNNANMLSEEDYQFIWAELLEHQSKFMTFLNQHNLNHRNLMTVIINWNNPEEEIGKQEVECNFTFYEMLDED